MFKVAPLSKSFFLSRPAGNIRVQGPPLPGEGDYGVSVEALAYTSPAHRIYPLSALR